MREPVITLQDEARLNSKETTDIHTYFEGDYGRWVWVPDEPPTEPEDAIPYHDGSTPYWVSNETINGKKKITITIEG